MRRMEVEGKEKGGNTKWRERVKERKKERK